MTDAIRRVGPQETRAVIVAALAALVSAIGLWDGWWNAPVERELKMSQKIFYFHAPLGICTILLTVVAAGAAIHYLRRRTEGADLLSEACMEVVLVSCGIVLVTGSLWAKPGWGEWLPWTEPRVTTMLVLFLIALGYAVLRSSVEEPERRARLSAVFAIIGAMDALLSYAAIHIWNTTHPRVITARGAQLQEDILRAFLICIGGIALWTVAVTGLRFRLARVRSRVERLEHRLMEIQEDRA